jgi:hypothetical protein
MLNRRALLLATIVGTVLQVAMVIAGHANKSIAGLFAVGGMGFSLIAGVLYVLYSRGGGPASPVLGGLLAGAICAVIGIFVSYMLGDVPVTLLALGTISSAVTGAIGGFAGRLFVRAPSSA